MTGDQQTLGLAETPTRTAAGIAPQPTSRKQKAIVAYLRTNGAMTLRQAVELVGGDIYTNEAKHVGAMLANMVRRGLIVRKQPGKFVLPQ